MNWFGETWNAPVCDPENHVDTPIGEWCSQCKQKIQEQDKGLMVPHDMGGTVTERPVHIKCFLVMVGLAEHAERLGF